MQPNQIFGTVAPPKGVPTDIGVFIAGSIRIFLYVALFVMFIYLLWGAYDWISSGGEKEKLSKAQGKLTAAIIGMIVAVVALTIFQVIAGNVLGIIQITPSGWQFNLPKL